MIDLDHRNKTMILFELDLEVRECDYTGHEYYVIYLVVLGGVDELQLSFSGTGSA